MDIAGGRERVGVEIGMRVQPQHRSFAGVAAMARHGADRADAQAVVAAQQDGQLALPQFGMHRVVDRAVPGGHFRQMAVAVDGGCQVGRAIQIAAVLDLEAWASMTGPRPATRRASGPMGAARRRRCRWARRSARDAARQGRGGRLGGFLHGADSGKERQNQAALKPPPARRRPDRHGGHILSAVAPAPALPWRDRVTLPWRGGRLRNNGPKAGSAGVHFSYSYP